MTEISFSVNQIETIFSNTFEGLISLEKIELGKSLYRAFLKGLITFILTDNNKISQINGKAFDGLKNLKEVKLHGNQCVDEDFGQANMTALIRVVSEKCGFKEEVCASFQSLK